MRRFLNLLIFSLVASSLNAATVGTSLGVEVISVTVNSTPTGYSYSIPAAGSAASGNHSRAAFYDAVGDGGATTGTRHSFSSYNSGAGTFPGTGTVTGWIKVVTTINKNGSGAVLATSSLYLQVGAPPPATYAVTFNVPANDTAGNVRYIFFQNGEAIAELVQEPGSPALLKQFTGLESDAPIEMVQVQQIREIIEDPLNPGEYITGSVTNGEPTVVSTGTPKVSTDPVPVVNAPPAPVPSTVTPTPTPVAPTPTTAPTSTTPTTSPTPTVPTFKVAPSGTAPVTKADAEATANQITTATDSVQAAVVDSGTKSIQATDKVATAVVDAGTKSIQATDKVATAVWEAGKANVDSSNKTNSLLSELNARLAAQPAQEKAAADSKAASDAAATAAAANATASGNAEGAAKKSQVEGAVGGRALKSYGSSANGSSSLLSITWPGVATIDLDPANDPQVSTLASWMKTGIAVLILALYDWWLWRWFKDLYAALAGTLPAKGNPVLAGTGAQATSLAVAVAITAVIVSLPTAFWAMADSGLTVTLLENPIAAAASGGGSLATGLYLFNFFFPTATLLAALSSVVIVWKGGLVLLGGMQTLVRFFVA